MKILIFASYRNKQKNRPDNCIGREDFESDSRLERRIKQLSGYNEEGWYRASRDYSAPAGEMFTGPMHTALREGLKQIRRHEQYGQTTIDLYFPSNYFRVDGKRDLVHENDLIVPFNNPPSPDRSVLEYGDGTNIPESITALIERYDLVFLLLIKEHIPLLQRVFEVERATPLIFLIARSNAQYATFAHDVPNVHAVYTADLVRQVNGVTNYNHQGAVFKKLCEAAYRDGFHVFEQVKQDPQQLLAIVRNQ